MIQLHNVEKTYSTAKGQIRALYPTTLDIQPGEIFGIVGQSGAGKSTLLRCMNLLERPTRGTVILDGVELTNLSNRGLRKARHRIGMIFQHFNLLHSQTVFNNIALPLKLTGQLKETIREKVESLLKLVGLPDKIHAYPAELSGGQKQRVAIARALADDPAILLCDEATSALDPQTTQNILELLLEINKKLGLTIALITHEMEVVKSICTQVAILEKGRVIEQGPTVHIFKNPQTPQAKEWVRSCLKQELPATLQARITPRKEKDLHPVLRIIFSGKTAGEPIISSLIQHHSVHVNILQANIEYIRQEALGIMVVKIESNSDNLIEILRFFEKNNIHAEVIGYVK